MSIAPLLALLVVCHQAGFASAQAPAPSGDGASTGTSDNKLLCMADMVSNIESSCSQPDTQVSYVALEAQLKEYLSKCFNTNFTQSRALHLMMPDLGQATTDYLKRKADAFKDRGQVEDVVPTFVPAAQINAEVEFMLQHNLANSHDGWIMDPSGFGIVGKYGGFYDIQPTAAEPAVQWDDVLPFVRERHVSFKGHVVALPLDLNMNLLFYRTDVLAALNMSGPPRTWQELADLVEAVHGLDLNGDNVTDYGICLERRKDCHTQSSDLFSIVAPMLQYEGTSQGIFFDPSKLGGSDRAAVLINNPAFKEALQLYVNLAKLAPPTAVTDKCDTTTGPAMVDLFRQGRCAVIFGSDIFKRLNGTGSFVRGLVGVALLPGSTTVLDRTTNTTVPCTRDLCPYGVDMMVPVEDNTTVAPAPPVINLAPFSAEGGWVAAVNAKAPVSDYQSIAAAYFAFLATPAASWEYMTNPAFRWEPYRTQHLVAWERWAAAGYEVNDASRWLDALGRAVDMNGLGRNVALDLRIPGTKYFRELFENAAANATTGADVNVVASALAVSVSRLLNDSQKLMATLGEVVDAYQGAIGYMLPPPPPAAPGTNGSPPSPDSGSGSPSWLPIAIVLPTVGALLLIAAAVVYEVRNNRKHKNLFGKVLPPGLGAETSILIACVQDLPALMDALPAEVMDRALRELGEVVRRLTAKHSGYEAGVEDGGGTLVLAFHSPKDALLFSMEMQHLLLSAPWPAELLAMPQCAPVYVQGMVRDTKPRNLQDILDVGDPAVGGLDTSTAYVQAASSKIKALAAGLTGHGRSAAERDSHNLGHGEHGLSGHLHGLHMPGGRHIGMGAIGPTIPALVNVPTSETYTFSIACQRAWKETSAGSSGDSKADAQKVLTFRGLRVYMGIHAGIHHPEDIQQAKGDTGAMYSGETVRLARAVAHAAHGGMVLLSEETYKKLPLERLWDKYLVLHVGEHRLVHEGLPHLNLYHALNRTLEGRLAYLDPVHSTTQLDLGVLDAPVGCVTVAFMNVVGVQTLLSWNADVAQQALKVFHGVVGEELKACKGYLVEAVDGLFLAAFQRPAEAILWALECNEHMIKQEWPDELLAHELCEELVISAPTKEGEVVNTVVFRGLRLKTGVDTGQVLGEVHAMTGRMTYRGKVMNRAARVASTASTGQVLCSSDSWGLAAAADAALIAQNKVTGTSLGQFRLKGVAEKIEIYHCRKVSSVAPARRASSLVVSMDHWKWEREVMGQAIGPEDILLGPGDTLRAALLAPTTFASGYNRGGGGVGHGGAYHARSNSHVGGPQRTVGPMSGEGEEGQGGEEPEEDGVEGEGGQGDEEGVSGQGVARGRLHTDDDIGC